MAAVGCSRCLLLRPSIALPIRRIEARATPVLSRAPFSSSAPTAAATVLKAAAGSSRQGHIVKAPRKKNYKKKGAALVRHKAPAPGERKAFRKRIQLSNNNALPVPGLLALSKENMADPESSGQIFSVPDVVVDQLRSVEAFKPTQTWGPLPPAQHARAVGHGAARREAGECCRGEGGLEVGCLRGQDSRQEHDVAPGHGPRLHERLGRDKHTRRYAGGAISPARTLLAAGC